MARRKNLRPANTSGVVSEADAEAIETQEYIDNPPVEDIEAERKYQREVEDFANTVKRVSKQRNDMAICKPCGNILRKINREGNCKNGHPLTTETRLADLAAFSLQGKPNPNAKTPPTPDELQAIEAVTDSLALNLTDQEFENLIDMRIAKEVYNQPKEISTETKVALVSILDQMSKILETLPEVIADAIAQSLLGLWEA